MPLTIKLGKEGSVALGRAKRVYCRDRRIAVFNDKGTIRAVDDVCTHVGGSLSEGLCEDGVVTCPWHGARFSLIDGKGVGSPIYRRLQIYPVNTREGLIEIEIEEEEW